MKHRKTIQMALACMMLLSIATMPALAIAESGTRDMRFVLPGETPQSGGGNTIISSGQSQSIPSSNMSGRDTRFILPGEAPRSSGSGGNIIISSGQPQSIPSGSMSGRDARFLVPEEITGSRGYTPTQGQTIIPSTSNMAGQDTRFRVPETATSRGTSTRRSTGAATIGNCKEWVNVRNDPSTKSAPIGRATLGESIVIIYWNDASDWAFATYRNGTAAGWISGKFVK